MLKKPKLTIIQKLGPECRFGIPRYPIWKTILSRPLKGESAEEKTKRGKTHKEVLEAVCEVLENEETIDSVMKEFGDKKAESKEEYIVNRKKMILKILEMAKVCKKSYLAAVVSKLREELVLFFKETLMSVTSTTITLNGFVPGMQTWIYRCVLISLQS